MKHVTHGLKRPQCNPEYSVSGSNESHYSYLPSKYLLTKAGRRYSHYTQFVSPHPIKCELLYSNLKYISWKRIWVCTGKIPIYISLKIFCFSYNLNFQVIGKTVPAEEHQF